MRNSGEKQIRRMRRAEPSNRPRLSSMGQNGRRVQQSYYGKLTGPAGGKDKGKGKSTRSDDVNKGKGLEVTA
eukprot:1801764-Amphidinium_carterae.2